MQIKGFVCPPAALPAPLSEGLSTLRSHPGTSLGSCPSRAHIDKSPAINAVQSTRSEGHGSHTRCLWVQRARAPHQQLHLLFRGQSLNPSAFWACKSRLGEWAASQGVEEMCGDLGTSLGLRLQLPELLLGFLGQKNEQSPNPGC